ncbi:LysM peptidoglycan-binding domain-containing protein [Jeotgalicoccus sp. WY2]|uniref:LysM peptidoglycan-binding domain-containing protein n=1 Tax=Jeotgalicoccus sp. WY2 TaxID=2708346 RepID=UPI001BD5021D|nr:LysM peptidoglycan-binding domain-containing protein [Jeotgalicoccus sp. WY2]
MEEDIYEESISFRCSSRCINDDSYSAEAASHTVESGDSLWALAEENNVTIESIKKENKLTSDIIVPGQIIEIDGEKEEKKKLKKKIKKKQKFTQSKQAIHYLKSQLNLM